VKILNKAKERFHTDGLNSIEYKLVETLKTALYTKFLVSYNQEAILIKHQIITTTITSSFNSNNSTSGTMNVS